ITTGVGGGNLAPDRVVRREEMASFLARALGLPDPTGDFPFTDVSAGSTHYADIHRIFIAGVTTGTSPETYAPTDPVTRAQMAAFLVRAYDLETVVAEGASG
ncbi:MAG: S-layer homology domain-containing protein, partial [Dehalococcoidia bacterium]